MRTNRVRRFPPTDKSGGTRAAIWVACTKNRIRCGEGQRTLTRPAFQRQRAEHLLQPMRCNNAGCATPARQMRLYPTDSRLFPTVSQVLPDCTGYTGGVWNRDVTSAMWWSLRATGGASHCRAHPARRKS
jgi:hypothetical protein